MPDTCRPAAHMMHAHTQRQRICVNRQALRCCSGRNGKATSRVNYWVIVQYLEGAAQVAVPYVTLVKFFVRVADPCTMRVAQTAPMCARKPMGAGTPAGRDGRAHVANMSRLVHRDYAVAITQVQRKLCCAFEIQYMEGTMHFMETLVQTRRT